ncbi:DUF2071 domain-containing protein [Parapedobacter defluvii]|uniref:DUF2071 domain-containing protein n=1 Tax=Parapedobacter defluvii TaxID=2045106 RepID=UPI0026A58D99
MDTEFEVKNPLAEKTARDRWLTERYCLYLDKEEAIYRYDIHHKEWEIKRVELKRLNLNCKIGAFGLTDKPDLMHYSNGVKVVAWKRTRI